MKIFYSPSKKGFYPKNLHPDYVAAGTLPDDLVEIPSEDYIKLQEGVSSGMQLFAGDDGVPRLLPQPPTPYAEQAEAVYDQFRRVRETVLNRLQGIGFAAWVAGDNATANACVSARESLLNVTQITASNVTSLEEAVAVEYDRIAASVPAPIRNAFAKLNFN